MADTKLITNTKRSTLIRILMHGKVKMISQNVIQARFSFLFAGDTTWADLTNSACHRCRQPSPEVGELGVRFGDVMNCRFCWMGLQKLISPLYFDSSNFVLICWANDLAREENDINAFLHDIHYCLFVES